MNYLSKKKIDKLVKGISKENKVRYWLCQPTELCTSSSTQSIQMY